MSKNTVEIVINDNGMEADREFLLDLSIMLSQYHRRICQKIAEAGNMRVSTELALTLDGVQNVYDSVEPDLNSLEGK